uniref:TSNAXIP1_N domain-containing protein n=1 Tax=Mesocestoides corti TaxID=53468 RepID=A0A5K3EX88_MESCO
FQRYKCTYAISPKAKNLVFNSKKNLDPIYKIYQGESELFYFPIPELPPVTDRSGLAGRALTVDPWPAYAGERTKTDSQVFVDGHRLIAQSKEHSKLKPPPKPKFLALLEHKILRDMKKLGIPEDTSNPLRLQLYREIFDRFIEKCVLYGPLLAKIKNQYEEFIVHLRKKIDEMLPIREHLWVASFNADESVRDFRNHENAEIVFLKSEMQRDKAKIEKLKQECTEL